MVSVKLALDLMHDEGVEPVFLPFQGIRVIDCTHVLAGPFCGYQLALLGADVIRIDRVDDSDMVRFGGPTPELKATGMSEGFLVQNANKRSLAVNVKDPKGQQIIKDLCADADVMLENFRPGVMDRLGLGHEELLHINPKLIYCSLTGFGQDGPLKDVPAYDFLMQGITGFMAVNAREDGAPHRIGFPIIDYVQGLLGAFAVSSALMNRERTGQGQYLDVAMLDAALIMLGPVIGPLLISQIETRATGGRNQAFSGSPFSGVFYAQDAAIVLVANTEKQVRSLLDALELGDIAADPRLKSWRSDQDFADAVRTSMSAALATAPADHWIAKLVEANVPAGPVNSMADILASEQVAARGLLHQVAGPAGFERELTLPGIGFRLNGASPGPTAPPPYLGEHTRDILRGAGFDDSSIDVLAADGVVKCHAGNRLTD